MTRFQTSWAIAKRSWAVLKSDKSLAWFPVLSFIGSLVVFGVIAGLVALSGMNSGSDSSSLAPMGYVLIAVGYVALALVQTYFLAALVAGADSRLRGHPSTISSAIEVANSRLHRLLPWAVVSATVSIILNALERQGGVFGRIVGSLLGMAWNLLTFLTIPILVLEDVGIGAAFTRSKDLFKKTWGENVIGQGGLGIVGFLAIIPGALVVAIGAALGTVGLVVFGAIGVAWILVSMVAMAALSGIYRTALYQYAATGQIPADFAGTDLANAFQPRKDNGRGGMGGFGGGFGGFNQN
ncbi:MAG TPA: DUF6159 family protein [Acidimicrobiia bacterium]